MKPKDWFLRVMVTLLVVGVWVLILRPYLLPSPSGREEPAPAKVHYTPPVEFDRVKVGTLVVPPDGLRFQTTDGKLVAELSADVLGGHLRLYDEKKKTTWMAPTGVDAEALLHERRPIERPTVGTKPRSARETLRVSRIVVPPGGLSFVTPEGHKLVRIDCNEYGGALSLWHGVGNAYLSVAPSEDRVDFFLHQKSGAPAVQMSVHERWGGLVSVRTGRGNEAVQLRGSRSGDPRHQLGGAVQVFDQRGNLAGSLP